jgi:hypothetical protein
MPLASTYAVSTGPLLPVELRASLRAAIRLEQRYGFTKLIRGIAEGSYTILSAIVRECASKDDATTILSVRPIGTLIRSLQAPCHAVVLALAGHELGTPGGKTHSGAKPVAFSEFYASLYRIAAGNLGWAPEQALSATLIEIVDAAKGRADLLASIFGGPEKPSEPVDPTTIDHSAGISRLREIFGSGGAR